MVFISTLSARSGERLRPVFVQFPPPPVKIAGMHLQCPCHLRRALSPGHLPDSCLFEFPAELPFGLHSQSSPFNDFQGLTGCLKIGVHSIASWWSGNDAVCP